MKIKSACRWRRSWEWDHESQPSSQRHGTHAQRRSESKNATSCPTGTFFPGPTRGLSLLFSVFSCRRRTSGSTNLLAESPPKVLSDRKSMDCDRKRCVDRTGTAWLLCNGFGNPLYVDCARVRLPGLLLAGAALAKSPLPSLAAVITRDADFFPNVSSMAFW